MLGLYSTFGSAWGYGRIIEEGAWWSGKSVFGKWIYVMRAGFTARTKYYALWSISEVSVPLGSDLIRTVLTAHYLLRNLGCVYSDRDWIQRVHHLVPTYRTLGPSSEH
jgi:hypothetical protein